MPIKSPIPRIDAAPVANRLYFELHGMRKDEVAAYLNKLLSSPERSKKTWGMAIAALYFLEKSLGGDAIARRAEEVALSFADLPAIQKSTPHFISSGAFEKKLSRAVMAVSTLRLAGERLSDGHLRALAPVLATCKRVEVIGLESNRFGAVGLRALLESGMGRTVKTLSLRQGPIGSNGAALLGRFQKLEQLDLFACNIGDAGVQAIASSKLASSLKAIVLHDNKITSAGFSCIARSEHLGELEYLDLGYNRVGVTGLLDWVSKGMKNCPKLSSLDLSGCGGTQKQLASLFALPPPPQLKKLAFSNVGDAKFRKDAKKQWKCLV